MKLKFLAAAIFATLVTFTGASLLTPTPASAACDSTFLGLPPWWRGIAKEETNCEVIMTPGVNGENDIDLTAFIWTIILNCLGMIFGIIGYIAIGFVIAGAFFYVLARGDPGKIAKGKNTVTRALIGLIICIGASLLSGVLVQIITEATGA